MRALRRNLTALARGKPVSVAPVAGAKPGVRAPFVTANHAAGESSPDAIRQLAYDSPENPTRRAQFTAAPATPVVVEDGETSAGAASAGPNHLFGAASIIAALRRSQGLSVLGRAQPGSFITQASELRKAMAAHKPWVIARASSGAPFSRFAAKRRNTLPSIAPIGRRDGGAHSTERQMSHKSDPVSSNGSQHSARHVPAEQKLDPLKLGGMLEELLTRQARLPPSGATAFDPRLTPAWPGLKLPA
jgi:hypothetical protein